MRGNFASWLAVVDPTRCGVVPLPINTDASSGQRTENCQSRRIRRQQTDAQVRG
ncbi:MAG: hypothetical protein Q8K38_07570 [Burkholderiaceae bacterium]|nr:hypothetical protein [Burkholderiaceae bacterium]MDZ4143739.1 hypothetical protein [Burkholderiales bacterium]MDZ4398350.1 hypothetical protein [Hydrogenophaga sp.]